MSQLNISRHLVSRILSGIIDEVVLGLFGKVAHARRKGVAVGDGCRLYIRNFGTEPFLITIGNRVTITTGVQLLTHDGSTWLIRDEDGKRYQRYAPITIGDDVFIGVNSIIMPGVTIGSHIVIGAGSVVTKDVPDYSVFAGNPARLIRDFDSFKQSVLDTCVNDQEIDYSLPRRERILNAISIASSKS